MVLDETGAMGCSDWICWQSRNLFNRAICHSRYGLQIAATAPRLSIQAHQNNRRYCIFSSHTTIDRPSCIEGSDIVEGFRISANSCKCDCGYASGVIVWLRTWSFEALQRCKWVFGGLIGLCVIETLAAVSSANKTSP